MSFWKTIDKFIRKLPGRKQDFAYVSKFFEPVIDAAYKAVRDHDWNLDDLAEEILKAATNAETDKFDILYDAGKQYLKREGKELKGEVLAAVVNKVQITLRM